MKSRTLLVVLIGLALGTAAAVGVLTAASDGTAASAEPPGGGALTAARFEISVDGVSVAAFSELVEIASGYDPEELELLTRGADVLLRVPGKRTPPVVTLERGMTASLELAAWHDLALTDNAAARRDATLTMYDAAGEPVVRYHLENAWPAKLEINSLAAGASEVLVETATFVADRIQRVAP